MRSIIYASDIFNFSVHPPDFPIHPVPQPDWEHVTKHTPNGWKEQNELESQEDDAKIEKICNIDDALHKKSKELS